eukprot:TRINITY_DN54303_c0_g1_i1.p2 TRINITY_DN54303_c0_g1~~TRINITY_DN54303_c0_g1_i1.p2  ORF type:complete len:161 (-),score=30.21 TRINITY_DN54303_c0_g1_i1:81-503(-)
MACRPLLLVCVAIFAGFPPGAHGLSSAEANAHTTREGNWWQSLRDAMSTHGSFLRGAFSASASPAHAQVSKHQPVALQTMDKRSQAKAAGFDDAPAPSQDASDQAEGGEKVGGVITVVLNSQLQLGKGRIVPRRKAHTDA